MSVISYLKKEVVRNYPKLLPYLYMIQRKSFKPIYKWSEESFKKGVMKCFRNHMGYTFDLDNPKTFNEKLQWYKVYYHRNDFSRITDKVLFKDYVKEIVGYDCSVKMYGAWENISSLEADWEKLPNTFVLKSNLMANSMGVIIIKDKSKIKFKTIKKKVSGWLNPLVTLKNSWDWHFYNSTPKILAEEFLIDDYGELRDYKFFCFNGEVPFFRVDYGRDDMHHATFFDKDMKEMDVSVPDFPKDNNADIILPSNINEMYQMAKHLSKDFPFIRIDFFSCNGRWYLSEFTFTPGGGVTHYPEKYNKEWGEYFKLPAIG